MTRLPNEEFRQLVCLMREKEFYESEEISPIDWPNYNLSQIKEAKETLNFIRTQVDETEVLLLKGKAGKPLTNSKSLVKAILVSDALGLTERNAQGRIEILGPYVGINEHLDDRTIGDAYDKVEVLYLLKQIFEKTKESNGTLSGDGTGLETSRKQNYETARRAGNYMTNIVDSREIVQSFDIYEQECKAMHMDLFLDVMAWLTEYHKRSHCESFHSSFKTRYGIITKRRIISILCQVTARIVLHNRRRLSYFNMLNC